MKEYMDKDVYTAAVERVNYVLDNFKKVYLSFSGGKDSGVMLNLVLDEMKKRDRSPLRVLYIDFEAQYKHTVDYCYRMLSIEEVTPYWVCLPIHLRNAVSQYQPHWICWEKEKKQAWVREMPEEAISNEDYFPFFRKGMEFEEFVPEFGEWFADGEPTACFVGIRSDESLNRFRTMKNEHKETHGGNMWSTRVSENVWNFYPIYDWRTEDIWTANGRFEWDYNKIYDLMHLAGLSIHQMRLCQPYGDDQRKGLYLFKILEPETWNAVVNRVEGANFGAKYVVGKNGQILGNKKIKLPPGHTWKSYTKFLLSTMPPYVAAHYRKKILVFLKWWRKNGREWGVLSIPDDDRRKMPNGKYYPSWWRICKVIIKNDYWCKGLSFSQTKRQMERHLDLVSKFVESNED